MIRINPEDEARVVGRDNGNAGKLYKIVGPLNKSSASMPRLPVIVSDGNGGWREFYNHDTNLFFTPLELDADVQLIELKDDEYGVEFGAKGFHILDAEDGGEGWRLAKSKYKTIGAGGFIVNP